MSDLAKLSRTKLEGVAQRAIGSARRIREQSAVIGERTAEVATSLVVGSAYAYVRGRYPQGTSARLWGTNLPLLPLLSGAVTFAGIFGYLGKMSDMGAIAGGACLNAEANLRSYGAGMKAAQEAAAKKAA